MTRKNRLLLVGRCPPVSLECEQYTSPHSDQAQHWDD
jgi:hypothetical protein